MTGRRLSLASFLMSAWALAAATTAPGHGAPPAPYQPAAVDTRYLYGASVADPVMSAEDGKRLEAKLLAESKQHREDILALKAAINDLRKAVGKDPIPEATAPAKFTLVPLAKKYCARCHVPSAAQDSGGGITLFATDEAAAFAPGMPTLIQSFVKSDVANGKMPPSGPKPTPAERELFQKFEVK